MPLVKGKSKKIISQNIAELQRSAPSVPRDKAIHTYMKRHNCDYSTAKTKLSVAIAMSKAGKSKK